MTDEYKKKLQIFDDLIRKVLWFWYLVFKIYGIEEYFPFFFYEVQMPGSSADRELINKIVPEDESFIVGHFIIIFENGVFNFLD